MGFYMAPNHAEIKPVSIPKNIELVELITGGEVFFKTDGKDKTFGKGTIFWHRTGENTIYRTTPQNPYRCVVFRFDVGDSVRPVPRVSFWKTDAYAEIDRFTSECLNLFHSRELNTDVLALYIYSTLLRHAMVSGGPFRRQNYPAPLDRILNYIHDNIGGKITVAVLAQNSRVSQPHLFKLFQTHLHITPHQYILSQQLLRARTMLAGTPLPIKVIASECGFNNLEVFYRHFRRESYMPPGAYRRKYLPYRTEESALM